MNDFNPVGNLDKIPLKQNKSYIIFHGRNMGW